jgi:hypothetical protein
MNKINNNNMINHFNYWTFFNVAIAFMSLAVILFNKNILDFIYFSFFTLKLKFSLAFFSLFASFWFLILYVVTLLATIRTYIRKNYIKENLPLILIFILIFSFFLPTSIFEYKELTVIQSGIFFPLLRIFESKILRTDFNSFHTASLLFKGKDKNRSNEASNQNNEDSGKTEYDLEEAARQARLDELLDRLHPTCPMPPSPPLTPYTAPRKLESGPSTNDSQVGPSSVRASLKGADVKKEEGSNMMMEEENQLPSIRSMPGLQTDLPPISEDNNLPPIRNIPRIQTDLPPISEDNNLPPIRNIPRIQTDLPPISELVELPKTPDYIDQPGVVTNYRPEQRDRLIIPTQEENINQEQANEQMDSDLDLDSDEDFDDIY